MNNRNKRTFASLLFMLVFSIKMIISVMPVFYLLDAKVAASVILQLEQETKAEKDTTDKDALKEKKDFDEHTYTCFDYTPVLVQTKHLHHFILSLPVQPYHNAVPTPPPNA
ncbi:hypothetical protein [Mucilaginibacter auburnensis]|nr:hypothetical protein [Mucilaginibacter auburnensis]